MSNTQALRLDPRAGAALRDGSLAGIGGIGASLRQLALLGLQHVSVDALAAVLPNLPLLQASRIYC